MNARNRNSLIGVSVVVVLALAGGFWLRQRAALARALIAEKAWTELAVELQRRENLVSPLMSIYRTQQKREEGLLQAITEAQTHCKVALEQLQTSPNDNPLARIRLERGVARCEEELGRNLSRLMAQSGKYPDLVANKTFQIFGEQLKSLEARVAAARLRFDAAASQY